MQLAERHIIMIEEIHAQLSSLKDVKHTLYGNGQPGLVKEFTAVKAKQEECPALLNAKRDNRAFAMSLICCGVAFVAGIILPGIGLCIKLWG